MQALRAVEQTLPEKLGICPGIGSFQEPTYRANSFVQAALEGKLEVVLEHYAHEPVDKKFDKDRLQKNTVDPTQKNDRNKFFAELRELAAPKGAGVCEERLERVRRSMRREYLGQPIDKVLPSASASYHRSQFNS